MLKDVFVISAKRSPIGKFLGALSSFSAVDLGVIVLKNIVDELSSRYGKGIIYDIDEVIVGNVLSTGLGQNPARQILIRAGLSNQIGGLTVNKVCGSGLKAIILGAQSIQVGESDLVVCGGIESMTNAPHFINLRRAAKFGDMKLVDSMQYDGLTDVYSNKIMGEYAEMISTELKVTRLEQDEFALNSHRKAIRAIKERLFKSEIVPIKVGDTEFAIDEGPREDTTLNKLSTLKPVFREGGVVTAGNSSQISDGAAFVVLASETALKEHKITPLAKILDYSTSGLEPQWLLMTPETAILKLLQKINSSLNDFDFVEINEAFAAQLVALKRKLTIPEEKLNVNGGAIALGHPLGCSGARIVVTLLWALKNYNKKKGIASLCMGGGNGLAIALEKI